MRAIDGNILAALEAHVHGGASEDERRGGGGARGAPPPPRPVPATFMTPTWPRKLSMLEGSLKGRGPKVCWPLPGLM